MSTSGPSSASTRIPRCTDAGRARVASLLERWLLGTHQGKVRPDHLDAYLKEFSFCFNRRTSRRRGLLFYRLLQQAILTAPITYRTLVVNPRPTGRRPTPPGSPGRLVAVSTAHPACGARRNT